jgi:hypothetical protein
VLLRGRIPGAHHRHRAIAAGQTQGHARSHCSAGSMLEKLANAVLFQVGWFTCVLGGNSLWLLMALAILLIHLRWIGLGGRRPS